MLFWSLIALFLLFSLVDRVYYAKANPIWRLSSYWYKLPGGGIVAYYKFRRTGFVPRQKNKPPSNGPAD